MKCHSPMAFVVLLSDFFLFSPLSLVFLQCLWMLASLGSGKNSDGWTCQCDRTNKFKTPSWTPTKSRFGDFGSFIHLYSIGKLSSASKYVVALSAFNLSFVFCEGWFQGFYAFLILHLLYVLWLLSKEKLSYLWRLVRLSHCFAYYFYLGYGFL